MKNTIIFLITLTLIFSSCIKDDIPEPPPPPKPDPCLNMHNLRSEAYGDFYKGPLTPCAVTLEYVYPDKYGYIHPCSNPNNEFEFCYLRGELNDTILFNGYELCVYNFCTNTNTVLASNAFYSTSWSSKGWIIYTGTDRQLWKIKSNGDSLIQLTNTGTYNNSAQWSPDGSKYLYFDARRAMVISDENGVELQELKPMQSWNWKNDSVIVFVSSALRVVLSEYNLNSQKQTDLFSVEGHGSSRPVYGKEGNVYMNIGNGLARVDLSTQNATTIVPEFGRAVGNIMANIYNENGKMLYVKILKDTFVSGFCEVNFRSHIAIMNLDGTDERHVLLPE